MHGEAKLLLKFLDGSDNRYIIPVYQRNYDWKPKQCEQLFNDLVQIIKKDRKSHFFGSIVTSSANKGGKSDYLVIDGLQMIRLNLLKVPTSLKTITILKTALRKMKSLLMILIVKHQKERKIIFCFYYISTAGKACFFFC